MVETGSRFQRHSKRLTALASLLSGVSAMLAGHWGLPVWSAGSDPSASSWYSEALGSSCSDYFTGGAEREGPVHAEGFPMSPL